MGSPNFLNFKPCFQALKCNEMFEWLERANFCNQRAITLCNINKKERVGRVDLQLSAVLKIRRFTPATVLSYRFPEALGLNSRALFKRKVHNCRLVIWVKTCYQSFIFFSLLVLVSEPQGKITKRETIRIGMFHILARPCSVFHHSLCESPFQLGQLPFNKA